ncbi:hypothetical protein MLD52_22975 [Puniceicoccaceae bacterium K14]|nr:hypothetical protein [Puniceicoccaceae bacterium K14]
MKKLITLLFATSLAFIVMSEERGYQNCGHRQIMDLFDIEHFSYKNEEKIQKFLGERFPIGISETDVIERLFTIADEKSTILEITYHDNQISVKFVCDEQYEENKGKHYTRWRSSVGFYFSKDKVLKEIMAGDGFVIIPGDPIPSFEDE